MNDAVSRASIFQGLDGAAVDTVVPQLVPVSFSRGEVMFTEGETGDVLYVIATGRVKLGRRTADGRESLLAVMGPGDVFGELALFDPGPRTSTVTTLTSVEAAMMDRDALRQWIAQHPVIAEQLLRVLARRLRRTNDTVSALIFTDVAARVAKHLLELASRWGVRHGASIRLDVELSQTETGQLIGASRETVNKALREFAHRGWIHMEGRTTFIDDPARLARRAR